MSFGGRGGLCCNATAYIGLLGVFFAGVVQHSYGAKGRCGRKAYCTAVSVSLGVTASTLRELLPAPHSSCIAAEREAWMYGGLLPLLALSKHFVCACARVWGRGRRWWFQVVQPHLAYTTAVLSSLFSAKGSECHPAIDL